MNEIELLKRLVKLEQQQYELENRIDNWSDDEEVKTFKQELADVNKEIEQIEHRLVEVYDKTYSKNAKKAMINQLMSYVTEINKARPGSKISRSQGLILKNHIFSGILQDLHRLITDEIFGYHIPAYLLYTYSDQDSVEVKDLTAFLKTEVQTLRNIENPNYIKLRQFYNEFRDRMMEKFIK